MRFFSLQLTTNVILMSFFGDFHFFMHFFEKKSCELRLSIRTKIGGLI